VKTVRLEGKAMARLTRLLPLVAVIAAGLSTMPAVPAAAAGDTSPPSAIGNEVVTGIAVSPLYARSGLVVGLGADTTNSKQQHLFISHDGGASWQRAAASGWNNAMPSIAVDGAGKEILYAGDKNSLLRSDNYGDSWTKAGAAGSAFASPHSATDGVIAVANTYANGTDYVLRNGVAQAVAGSGGALIDHQYAFSPAYPKASQQPVALLSADDPKTGYPEIERCTADFACSAPVTLPGSNTFSGFATLSLSSAFDSDGVVFAQSSTNLGKSSDGGKTFTPIVPLTSTAAAGIAYTGLVLDPQYSEATGPHTVYASEVLAYTDKTHPHTESGVFRSTDGGTTWTRLGIGTHLADYTTSLAIAPDGRLFAAYAYFQSSPVQAGLLCSADGGNSWHTYCPHVGNYTGPKAAGGTVTPGAAGKAGTGGGSSAQGNGSQGGSNAGTAPNGQTGQSGSGSGSGASAPTGASVEQPGRSHNWTLTIILSVLAVAFTAFAVLQQRRRRRNQPVSAPTDGT
jgi:photosystem II stability/assembly factor-like uncharacterized protein